MPTLRDWSNLARDAYVIMTGFESPQRKVQAEHAALSSATWKIFGDLPVADLGAEQAYAP